MPLRAMDTAICRRCLITAALGNPVTNACNLSLGFKPCEVRVVVEIQQTLERQRGPRPPPLCCGAIVTIAQTFFQPFGCNERNWIFRNLEFKEKSLTLAKKSLSLEKKSLSLAEKFSSLGKSY